jgi:hypothetical protein
MQTPSVANQYGYCEANSSSFMGSFQQTCENCLRDTTETLYLANCEHEPSLYRYSALLTRQFIVLIALEAGCAQRPVPGALVGLDGGLFEDKKVNITSPIVATGTKHKSLTVGAIIGIAVGGVVFLLIVAAVIFICMRKRAARRNIRVKSALDSRYGNKEISSPINGAYGDPNAAGSFQNGNYSNYQSISLSKILPSIKTSLNEHDYQPKEDHYSHSPPYYNKTSSEDHRFKIKQIRPSPAYSPDGSTQLGMTPVSAISYGKTPTSAVSQGFSPALATSQESNTQMPLVSSTSHPARSPPATAAMRGKPTPPITGSGLPKRSPSHIINSNNMNTSSMPRATSNSPVNVRHTLDLSLGRGALAQPHGHQISGPLVTVGSRVEEEEATRKRRERERLYREGLITRERMEADGIAGHGVGGGGGGGKKEERGFRRMSEMGEELW